jgi:RNA polymerase sigma factor (sigma-70 family)
MLTTTSDEMLVARVRAGDERAFELLHDRYRGRLERFAERLLGSRAAAAEDVVQESLWRAHRALLADDRPIAVRAWLFTIVRNRCFDVIRREPVLAHEVLEAVDGREDDAHARLIRRDRLSAVVSDVLALPERQRAALVGHVMCDKPHTTVARELGTSVSATKTLVSRARTSLARMDAQRLA